MRRGLLGIAVAIVAFACVLANARGARATPEPLFAERVAARCAGEARWAIAPCACVVRNRVAGGWDETHVLDAFFAMDVPATAAEVDLAQRVLDGAWPCDGRGWYLFSDGDRRRLGLSVQDALLVAAREGWSVFVYGKEALQ